MSLLSKPIPIWLAVALAATVGALAVVAGAIAERAEKPTPIDAMRAELPRITAEKPASGRIVQPAKVMKSRHFKYIAASFDNPAGAQTVAGVRCPRGSQVTGGGGLSQSRSPGQQAVSSTLPFDGADDNKRTDDGWIVAMDNTSNAALRFGVYAVCRTR